MYVYQCLSYVAAFVTLNGSKRRIEFMTKTGKMHVCYMMRAIEHICRSQCTKWHKVQLQEPQNKNGSCLHHPLDKNTGEGMGMLTNQSKASCHDVFKQVLFHVLFPTFSCLINWVLPISISLRQIPFHWTKHMFCAG